MIGPDYGICDLLDKYILQKIKDSPYKGFPLRPSSSGKCARQLGYELMEFREYAKYDSKSLSPEVWRLLNLGYGVEFNSLKNFELIKDFETKYKQQTVTLFKLNDVDDVKGELIEGKPDAILWAKEWKAIMDIKSAGDGWSMAYRSRWEENLDKYGHMKSLQKISNNEFWTADLDQLVGELKEDYLIDNLLQINMYLNSDFARERDINFGVVYKYNKNNSKHYIIRFAPSINLFNYVKDKFQDVNEKITRHKDPNLIKKEFLLGSQRCSFCPYSKTCWPEIDVNKEYWKTQPKKKWPTDLKESNKVHKTLITLVTELKELSLTALKTKELEDQVIELMLDNNLEKIRLDNGEIYMLKYLKTPKEHYELRRSKL